MNTHRLEKEDTALLVIDIQEKLSAAMPKEQLARMVSRTSAAIRGAQALSLPIVVTEQYPKGLGPTLASVQQLFGESWLPIEKLQFSCVLPTVLERFGDRRQILVVGMETHVCVFQTVRDLVARNFKPYVCCDAVVSRHPKDYELGLSLCQQEGAVLTTVETALFDMLKMAGTPEFKAISAAVK